jgi:hypothetical protein
MSRRWRSTLAVTAAGLAVTGCGSATPPDTPTVVLADVRVPGDAWLLEGRRRDGQLCAALRIDSLTEPIAARCGVVRTELRHLEPVTAGIGDEVVLFSALPSAARRVRIDGADGSLHIVPASTAPGFPGRFFSAVLDPATSPQTVRIFADRGRAVIP